jgi:hypothetical protein
MSMGRKFRTLIKERKFVATPGITTPLQYYKIESATVERQSGSRKSSVWSIRALWAR